LEENHTIPEAPSADQATEEPSVLLPTSSPSSSNVEEEFELSNLKSKDEGNHGEKIADPEDTMEEAEHTQQDNKEVDCLSELEDFFD
ncbi:hypothetical protein KI387_010805, partial [Taxus chinensis]